MNYVYLALFIITSIVHLYYSYERNDRGRAATKGFPLMMLLGYYIESVATPSWTLIAALLMSWLGDMLLIGKGTKWFTFGGFAFMASHALFIPTYLKNMPAIGTAWIIYVTLAYIGITIALSVLILSVIETKALRVGMPIYFLFNCMMNASACLRFFGRRDIMSAITLFGALLFLISDVTLFYVRFNPSSKRSHFPVMITYILGEFLIVAGLIV